MGVIIYATGAHELDLPHEFLKGMAVEFEVSKTRFKLSAPAADGKSTWYITDDSRIWKEKGAIPIKPKAFDFPDFFPLVRQIQLFKYFLSTRWRS